MSKKLLNTAKDQDCINPWCKGETPGTTVSAHYNGAFSHFLGGGMARKALDFFTAWFCSGCHEHFDQYKGVTAKPGTTEHEAQSMGREAQFLVCILLTAEKRWRLFWG